MIRTLLKTKRLYWDGGMGSLLQAKGLKPGELPETWNLSHPDIITDIAREYLAAGSNLINTNTFGANRLKYPDSLKEIIFSAVSHVKDAIRAEGREDDAFTVLDIGPTGKLLSPMGDLDFEDAVSIFGEIASLGEEAGADLILIETMSDSYEMKAAVLGAKENSSLPVAATAVFDGSGKLMTGGTPLSVIAMLEGLKADAIGINCGLGPAQMLPIAEEFVKEASVPVIVNPNAGLPREENGRTVYDLTPGIFADMMKKIAELGVQILGGCCGTTPEHIRALKDRCDCIPYTAPVFRDRTVISSFSKALVIGESPLIVGERINPTGKKRFRQALIDKDIDYILSQAVEQEDAGADILDVNVGIPDIDEPSMMQTVITRLQAICALPLQIDTSSPEALEAALRRYNGKPLINSVNAGADSIANVMPLVRKYGGVLVGLCLDESGIPDTADGRIRAADAIYEAAGRYGIPRKDIVIDGLTLTVSSDPSSALTTLETVKRISERGGHTILGVSNISFGLPKRENINSAFYIMALREGLSLAIINPNSEAMMRAHRSYLALSGRDKSFAGYIAAYGGDAQPKASSVPVTVAAADTDHEKALYESIVRGIPERASAFTSNLLKSGTEALAIIDTILVPALDEVGRGYESKKLFLPQLLQSADAAQAAFAVIKNSFSSAERTSKGRIILATVRNDIHDIGKNIVKVMLENYGFDVLDLGRDVPPEVIVDEAVKNDIKLVGLSALMTTTVVSMEETIKLLREKKPDTLVIVGGAVMTPEYAEKIGADAYAKDAMETVRYADKVFSTS
ncbi:MAG: homocysteine S-methyltransferase family protein [Lachnospiraceae bacterium]|nr:homocysteine S-methyltransferase family protein [Lachnospiraceae bacterium]